MKRSVLRMAFLQQNMPLKAITTFLIAFQCQISLAQTDFRQQVLTGIHEYVQLHAEELKNSGQGELTHKVRGLDPRLQLKPCSVEPEVVALNDNWLRKRSYVTVSCPAPQWSLNVGLELSLYRDVLISRVPVERNTTLEKEVEFDSRDILAIQNGYIDNMDDIAGMVTKRSLLMGQVISPYMLKAEVLVPRNALVEVTAQIGGISVSSQGIALENGAYGEFIRVRNKRSNRIIEARVVKENKVEVAL